MRKYTDEVRGPTHRRLSRRRILQGGVGLSFVLLGAGAAAAQPAPGPASKARKNVVYYRDRPNGDQRCELCRNFLAETNECQQVEGRIAPEGWCRLWMPRQELDQIPRRQHRPPGG